MIHKLPTRREYARTGQSRPCAPGQLAFGFPGAVVAPFTPVARVTNPYLKALRLDAAGNEVAARATYYEAIADGEHVADSLCNLGVIASGQSKTDEALSLFTRALQVEPGHATTHYNLGILFDDMGHFPAARLHYEIALFIHPTPSTCYNLALLLERSGAIAEAVAILAPCLHLENDASRDIADLYQSLSQALHSSPRAI